MWNGPLQDILQDNNKCKAKSDVKFLLGWCKSCVGRCSNKNIAKHWDLRRALLPDKKFGNGAFAHLLTCSRSSFTFYGGIWKGIFVPHFESPTHQISSKSYGKFSENYVHVRNRTSNIIGRRVQNRPPSSSYPGKANSLRNQTWR